MQQPGCCWWCCGCCVFICADESFVDVDDNIDVVAVLLDLAVDAYIVIGNVTDFLDCLMIIGCLQ